MFFFNQYSLINYIATFAKFCLNKAQRICMRFQYIISGFDFGCSRARNSIFFRWPYDHSPLKSKGSRTENRESKATYFPKKYIFRAKCWTLNSRTRNARTKCEMGNFKSFFKKENVQHRVPSSWHSRERARV